MHKHAAANRFYRLVWSTVHRCWVAVAEGTRSHGKGGARRRAAAVLAAGLALAGGAAAAPPSTALPSGMQLVAGQAGVTQQGSSMTVRQATQQAILHWQDFQIGADASLRFEQPSASAVALNRVVGGEASAVFGKLTANGKVFLVNPQGVLFGAGAQVDAGGLVASSLDISDRDFLSGSYAFAGSAAAGAVRNAGSIHAAGGVVALLAPAVSNSGSITAPGGSVALAAASAVGLDFRGDGMVSVRVERGALDALAENKGLVQADGGRVLLTAQAADALARSTVNNSGVVQARGLVAEGGTIRLVGDGQVQAGRLDASAAHGQGGSVSVTGGFVALDGAVRADGLAGGSIAVQAAGDLSSAAALSAAGAAGRGGAIALSAGASVVENHSSAADASGATDGGAIALRAGTSLLSSGRHDAHGATGQGGRVDLGGADVRLLGARIDASGATQGGLVRVGGAFQGGAARADAPDAERFAGRWSAPAMASAEATFVNDSTHVDVSARGAAGQGGTAIVWSQAQTTMLGAIAAGGAARGGAVEISSAGELRHVGLDGLDIGAGGRLLLDPKNIVIGNNPNVWTYDAIIGKGFGGGKARDVAGLQEGDAFGYSVALTSDGRGLAVGAPFDDGVAGAADQNYGAVRLFTFSDAAFGGGTLVGTIGHGYSGGDNYNMAARLAGNDLFGSAVALDGSGSMLAVGALGADLTGSVYTFKFGSGFSAPALHQTLASNHAGAGGFGVSVALNGAGDKLAVGALYGNRVELFGMSGASFAHASTIQGEADTQFGTAVALDDGGSRLAVGAPAYDGGRGKVFLYQDAFGGNSLRHAIAHGDSAVGSLAEGELFGSALAFNDAGNRLAVGAPGNGGAGSSGTGPGAVRVFDFGSDLTTPSLQGVLGHDFTSGASPALELDDYGNFGFAVALNGAGDSLLASQPFSNSADGTVLASGTLSLYRLLPTPAPSSLSFDQASPKAGRSVAVDAQKLAAVLASGTSITLQANNDITWEAGNAVSINGNGDLTLQAGRSVALNSAITMDGKLAVLANAGTAAGVVDAYRAVGAAGISVAPGSAIDAGAVDLILGAGVGQSNKTSGDITIGAAVRGDTVRVLNQGPTAGSDIIINAGGALAGNGGAKLTVEAAAAGSGGGTFVNNAGAGGLQPGLGGYFHVYADAPQTALENVASYSKHYDQAYTGTAPAYATGGNWFFYTLAPTLNVSAQAASKVYDGTLSLPTLTYNVSGYIDGDSGNLTGALGASNLARGVGNYTISQGTLSSAQGYRINFTGAALQVTKRVLNVTATGNSKVYDGLAAASVTLGDDRVAGDVLSASAASSTFGDKHVGSGKSVSVSGIALTGLDAGNYTLAKTTAATTASITPRMLNASATASDKVYDGGLAASATLGDDRVGGDVLTLSHGGAAFADKHAGSGKSVQVSGLALSGADAANYVLASTATSATASITPRQLSVAVNAADKVYDGTLAATASYADNRVGGDELVISGSATFGTKDVGAGKSVTASGLSLSGADAANYALASASATGTAAITPRVLAVTATGNNKIYDGTTTASVHFGDDRVAGDLLAVSGTATFGDKHVGSDKAISVSGLALSGANAGNYALSTNTAAATGSITPRTLNVGTNGGNKTYDGSTAAALILTDDRVNGDSLALAGASASFADKNVGTGKAVTVTGITMGGADAANYVLASTTATGAADIAARSLAVTASGVDRVYDGGTAASVSFGDNRLAGDELTISGNAAFGDKHAGNGKAVQVSAIALAGADAGNYVLAADSVGTTANITQRALTVTATGVTKVYDGTTAATAVLADDRIGGDTLALGYASAAFADRHAGSGKAVSVTGLTLGGTDAGNYQLAATGVAAFGDITPRTLSVGVVANNKVYDGGTAAVVSFTDNRVAGDALTVAGSAAFADRHAGSAKTVTATGLALSGADAGNYVLGSASAVATADITRRTLNVSAQGGSKIYDGTTGATVTFSDDRLAGDALAVSGSGAFADKHVGSGKSIQVSGMALSGADAGNYVLAGVSAGTTGNISQRTLQVGAVGQNKVYDGTAAASALLSDDRVGGDLLDVTGASASFADKNVGTGKAVTVTGITMGGADAANYVLASTTATGAADIAARSLAVTASGVDRVYDGGTAASVSFGDNRLAGDELTISGNAAFGDKHAGNGKAVQVSAIALAGADAGNYVLAADSVGTTANITQRALTVTATGVTKVYDGTTAATAVLADDRIGGDTLALGYASAAFADRHAGSGKAVSVTGMTLGGADAGNYVLTANTAAAIADITPRALTVTATGVGKVYDGTTAASVTFADNRVAGDVLSVAGTAAFADKHAGSAKAIAVSAISLSGADAGNYALATGMTAASADIAQRVLAVTANGASKVYDGSSAAVLSFADDRVAGDVLTLAGNGSFADKHVGNGKAVSATGITLGGADAGNYRLAATTASGTGAITPRSLSVSVTAADKIYDGGTAASVSLAGDDRIAGDQIVLDGGSGSFADKHVGSNKAVRLTGVNIGGADAGNYTVSVNASSTASITPRALEVSATGVDKIYDGTLAAAVRFGDNRVAGDSLQVIGDASFADPHVGKGKAIAVSGITLAGADAGNYKVVGAASAQATVAPKALTVVANGAIGKVYDGSSAVQLQAGLVGLSGFAAGEGAAVGQLSGQFNSANVLEANSVSAVLREGAVSTLGGTLLSNYTLPANITLPGSISARPLSIGGVAAASKTYDGTVGASLSHIGTLSGMVGGESVTLLAPPSVQFDSRDAGSAKLVTASGYRLADGSGLASNYALAASSVTTTGAITPAPLVVQADDQLRDFGAANPALTWSAVGFAGGDTAALLGQVRVSTEAAVDAPPGSYAITIGGDSLQNYVVRYVDGVLTVQRAPQRLDSAIGGALNPRLPTAADAAPGAMLSSLPAPAPQAQEALAAGAPTPGLAGAAGAAQVDTGGGVTPRQPEEEAREYTIGGGSRVMVRGGGVNAGGAPD
jgi:filamentous hemagglutinin family protein